MVSWVGDCGEARNRGFAFQPAAVELWRDLVNAEIGGGAGVSGAALAYLGPNGERAAETEVSSTFSKVVGSGETRSEP